MGKLLVALWLTTLASVGLVQAQEPVLIGRVAHIEGGVLRYVTVEDDWVATVADSPLRADDIIYTEPQGRAEFIFPNNTWLRVDGNTGVDVIGLRKDLTGIYVDGGVVRIYNRSQEALVRLETRLGYLAAEPGDVVDVYVGDKDIQIIALEGSPNFFYTGRGREEVRYEVLADGPAIFVDETSVEAAEPLVDRDWESWNYKRDQLLAERRRVRSAHLPEAFQSDAHVFETQGRWERVYYKEKYVWCWTPIHVDVTWRPFTVGRWTTYYEENVWVPYEPWGWVTHHHGHWIQVENRWWWTPYVSVNVVSPGVDVRVDVGVPPPPDYYWYWHPGRVAWIHSEVHVGWFPLAPWEPYYGWHPWYGNTVVVNNTNITNININISNYNYFGNAVIVNYNNFYNVPYGNNYIQNNVVNITNINNTTIINNYYAAPVIHKTVIKNQNFFKNQYNFSDRQIVYKPHNSVVEKASFAKNNFDKHGFGSAAEYHGKRDKVLKADPPLGDANKRAKGLSTANKLVKPEDVKKPASQMKFASKEPKLQAERPKLHDAEKQSSRSIKEAASQKGPGREGRSERLGKGGLQEGPGKTREDRLGGLGEKRGREDSLKPPTQDTRQGRSSRDRDIQVQGEGRKGALEDTGSRTGRRLRPEREGERGELKGGSAAGKPLTGQERGESKLTDRPGSAGKPDRGLKGVDRPAGSTQMEDRPGQIKREAEKGGKARDLGRQEESKGPSQSLTEKSKRGGLQEGLRGEQQGPAGGAQKPQDKSRLTGQEPHGQVDKPKRSSQELGQKGQEKRPGQERKQLHDQGTLQQGPQSQQQLKQQQEKQKQQQHVQDQQKQQQRQLQQEQERQKQQQEQQRQKQQQQQLKQQQAQEQQKHQQQKQLQQQNQQHQQQKQLQQQQEQQRQKQQQQQQQLKQQQAQEQQKHQQQKQLQQQNQQHQQQKQLQQHAPQGQKGQQPQEDPQKKKKKPLPGEQPQ